MAKIETYPDGAPLDGSEKLIGTDVNNGNATKNFTVQDIADFTTGSSGSVVNSVSGLGPISTSPTTGNVGVSLDTVPGAQGTYQYANVNVDQYGRVVSASTNTPVTSVNGIDGDVTLSAGSGATVTTDPLNPQNIIIAAPGGGGGSGSVTQVDTGIGLTGGPITTTGTIDLEALPAPLVPGAYTNANVTVDAYGRVTDVSDGNGQPDQDLQSVLTTGNTATTGITLDSGASMVLNGGGISALSGAAVVQDVTWSNLADGYNAIITNELDLSCNVVDAYGASGTYQQVLIADPSLNGGIGGVQWVDQPVLSVRTVIPAATLATLGPSSGPTIVASPGPGKYIQVIAAAYRFAYSAPVYVIVGDIGLYTASTAQYTLPGTILNVPATTIQQMNVATNAQLAENTPLNMYLTGAVTSPGGGDLYLEVTYKIVQI